MQWGLFKRPGMSILTTDKLGITMVQLTTEQRIFVVKTFQETKRLQATPDAFRQRFRGREPPGKKTIWANVKNYQAHGTSLNRNRGHSGRPRRARSAANIQAVRQQLVNHPRQTSARRNGVGLCHASFNRITRLDQHLHPLHIHIRHELLPADFPRRQQFCDWLLDRCQRDPRS